MRFARFRFSIGMTVLVRVALVMVSADSTFVTPAEAGVQTEKTRDLRALPGSRPTPTTVREKN